MAATPRRGEEGLLCTEKPQIGLFVSTLNHQLPPYCAKHQDPLVYATDAVSIPWKGILGYALPPFAIITKVLEKVISAKAMHPPNRTILAPEAMVHMSDQLADIDNPTLLPVRRDLLRQPGANTFHPEPQKQNLTLWPISGNMLRR